ncbi:MAG: DUF2142 domain-containing protein [Microbacteriaceae bacterium]
MTRSTRSVTPAGRRRGMRGLGLVALAPVLALIALLCWAFASPVGGSPDDDYHLTSTWCAVERAGLCEPGSEADSRLVPEAVAAPACYAFDQDESAACQGDDFGADSEPRVETSRGNFSGGYPPVFYAVTNLLASPDIQVSALLLRALNILLFVGLSTAVFALVQAARRQQLVLTWMITTVPLTAYLVASNNPSAWAVTGVGIAWPALMGYFDEVGRRRVALGALFAVGTLMAAGSRGDSAVYAVLAIAAVVLLRFRKEPGFWKLLLLPAAAILVALVLFSMAGQTAAGVGGFTGPVRSGGEVLPGSDSSGATGTSESSEADAGADRTAALSGIALVAYNLLAVPELWAGALGSWPLGWFDTPVPSLVGLVGIAAFAVIGFAGLRGMWWRKLVVVIGAVLVLWLLPVWVLSRGGSVVGEAVQPRYLLPVLVLVAAALLTTRHAARPLAFGRLQLIVVAAALSVTHLIALHFVMRRYVTGNDALAPSLDAGAEWWWTLPVGPNVVWAVGSLAFAGCLAVLVRELLRLSSAASLDTALAVSPALVDAPKTRDAARG